MIIALIIALAGILLFLLLSPVPLSQSATRSVQQRNEVEEAGLEVFAHDAQLRGEAHQHG
jgi:hypothetical protein